MMPLLTFLLPSTTRNGKPTTQEPSPAAIAYGVNEKLNTRRKNRTLRAGTGAGMTLDTMSSRVRT